VNNLTKYVSISIDPGSISCGIAVFDSLGKYIDSFEVKVPNYLMPSTRLFKMRERFEVIWREKFPDTLANVCTLELLPPSKCAVLQNSAGAILSSGFIVADLPAKNYIAPPTWKSEMRKLGASGEVIKGKHTLNAIGWKYAEPPGDDAADAIIIYQAARRKQGKEIWIGDNISVQPQPYAEKKRKKK